MTRLSSYFYLFIVLSIAACQDKETINPKSPPIGTTTNAQVIEGNTQFALDIYKEVIDENKNQMLSPLSISTALAMVYAGTDGNTSTEMKNVLGFGPNNSSFHQAYNQVTNNIERNINNASNNEINIINKIWRNTSFHFLPTFENIMNTDYLAPVAATDFSQSLTATQEINSWVDQQTHQLIPELLPDGFIQNNTKTVLVNAVYFKANWSSQFAIETPSSFKTSNSTVTADMMYGLLSTNSLRFTEDNSAEVLELFFEDKQSSMVIVLPKDQTVGINDFVQQTLSKPKIDQWFNNLAYPPTGFFRVQIPKWDFENDFNLKKTLSDMGIKDLFSTNANLSKMANGPLSVNAIKHKTVIKTHRGGIEAAAATAIGIITTFTPTPIRTIRADRPFVFMVKDTETNSILFIGHVQDPS